MLACHAPGSPLRPGTGGPSPRAVSPRPAASPPGPGPRLDREKLKHMLARATLPVLAAAVLLSAPFYAQKQGAGARVDYVDSRVCATCHRQIAEDYARTGMGRSFF